MTWLWRSAAFATLCIPAVARAEPVTTEVEAPTTSMPTALESPTSTATNHSPPSAVEIDHDTPNLERRERDDAELRARVERLESSLEQITSEYAAARAATPTAPAPPPPALQPTILGEADYRVYPSKTEGNTGFTIARLRPGLVLSPLPWFRAVSTIEFAGENPVILDAFMRLRATAATEFTVGYSKPPLFASAVYEPVHTLPFPDRAPVVTSFRVRRDLGVDVHLAPRGVPLEGWLRVGNGAGSPLGNDNALPAIYGALDVVQGRASRHSDPEDRALGLRLGVSALLEKASDRDGISGSTPLGFVYFRPIVISGLRVIGAGHAIAYAGSARLTLEGAIARESRSRDADGNPATARLDLPSLHSYGTSLELAWVVRGMPREVGRAPKAIQQETGAWTGGALELAARYDGIWLGRGASDVDRGGSQGGAFAVKWWPLDFLAVTAAGYVTHFDVAPIEEPNERWSWGALLRSSFFWGLPD